jgi:predicted transposase/invertase (TIGR01784 family)
LNKKDIILKKVLSNNERFASIFNNYFFEGKNIIDPNSLKDGNVELEIKSLDGEYVNRIRDLIKEGTYKFDGSENNYVLLGIENQTSIDKYMPFRIMLYDSLIYDYQIMNFKKNKKDAKIKLKPVITLVIYYGTKKWNHSFDIIDNLDVDSNIKEYISNYKIKVLSISELTDEELESYNKDIRQLFKYVKKSNNKEDISSIMTDNDFKKVKKEIVDAINILTKSNIKYEEGDDEVNMCKGLDELLQDTRDEATTKKETEVVKTMHNNGFDIKTIAKALSLDINYVKLVLSK